MSFVKEDLTGYAIMSFMATADYHSILVHYNQSDLLFDEWSTEDMRFDDLLKCLFLSENKNTF